MASYPQKLQNYIPMYSYIQYNKVGHFMLFQELLMSCKPLTLLHFSELFNYYYSINDILLVEPCVQNK